MTFYKEEGYRMEDYPQTYLNYCCEITLPVYYNLNDEMVQEVINAVVTSVEEVMG